MVRDAGLQHTDVRRSKVGSSRNNVEDSTAIVGRSRHMTMQAVSAENLEQMSTVKVVRSIEPDVEIACHNHSFRARRQLIE